MKRILAKANRAKTSETQPLESVLAARRRSQAGLVQLRKLLADKSARRIALETMGDLNNRAVIAEFSDLQVFAELLPRRIAAKEQDNVKAEETLTQATNQFIHEHLGPCVRWLAAQTRVIVERELSSHYRERSALIVAVSESDRVWNIERLAWAVSLHPERGAIEHAEGALKAWKAVDEFEKTLPLSGSR